VPDVVYGVTRLRLRWLGGGGVLGRLVLVGIDWLSVLRLDLLPGLLLNAVTPVPLKAFILRTQRMVHHELGRRGALVRPVGLLRFLGERIHRVAGGRGGVVDVVGSGDIRGRRFVVALVRSCWGRGCRMFK